ncbi:enoyl-CoA hydratase/isomerase family protein [Pseudomonas sp. R3.Fl]|uniref:enoyl-CoA hydratase/isomerase family protein n=1 Tax=Pseudomonas sp. R3.Fl TaxID=2928708 RepID=UPI00201E730C|nr:enoyl-CoA hydratase/isomerase family protein [Pseudomonas sp. R3.Fl]MCL6691314.1 enoyl-CoA hydratase/isomerase family protein [Pseudomonas sp. R3.Fl]
MNMTPAILIEESLDNRLLTATFNRPDKANSIDREMANALQALAERVEQSPHIDAVIFTGSGRIFCAGGDISAFGQALRQSPGALPELLNELATTVHGALLRLVEAGPLLVGAINGPATGAGMALACACDIAYARPGAVLRAGFSRLGLSPDSGSTHFLPRAIGYKRALEFLLSGAPMSALQAHEFGIYSELLDLDQDAFSDEVHNRTLQLIASGAAVRATRNLLRASPDTPLEQQLDVERKRLVDLAGTPDVIAGIGRLLGGAGSGQ